MSVEEGAFPKLSMEDPHAPTHTRDLKWRSAVCYLQPSCSIWKSWMLPFVFAVIGCWAIHGRQDRVGQPTLAF